MVRRASRRRRQRSSDRPKTSEIERGTSGGKRLTTAGVVAALLIVHGTLAATSVRHKCCTFDEVAHLTKGYAYWNLRDNRLMPDHPPLAQAWAALPLLDDGLRFPGLDQKAWYGSDIYALGKQFFYRMGNDPDAMLMQSRIMVILLSVALGGLVFWWSRRLFGVVGGLVSLALYTFSPTVLAHGRLVTTDMVVSLFFLLSVTAVWQVLHRLTWLSLLGCSGALAGLFLSKMSAVLILPMAAVLVVVRLIRGGPRSVRLGKAREVSGRWKLAAVSLGAGAVCLAVVWFALWAAFGFRYEAMIDAEPGRDQFFSASAVPEGKTVWEHQSRGIPRMAAVVDWVRHRRLVPEAYLYGFLSTLQAARGRDAFLDGERRLTGWRYFFSLCFLYKVPLPIMGMIALAVVGFLVLPWARGGRADGIETSWMRRFPGEVYRTAPLWALFVTYWVFAITAKLNIGHRHLLPTFAPMFVLCGAAGAWLAVSRRWVRVLVPGLVGLLAITSLLTWPHYLAYFNSIAGGPSNGYRHLVDSSLDWGQDLPGLKRWLAENRKGEDAYVAYFGTGNLKQYGITAPYIPRSLSASGMGDYRLRAGVYCISATRLQQVYLLKQSRWTDALEHEYRGLLPEMREFEDSPNEKDVRAALLGKSGAGFKKRFKRFARLRFGRLCAHLRQREPEDHVGHSILIYRLTEDDLTDALYGPWSEGR